MSQPPNNQVSIQPTQAFEPNSAELDIDPVLVNAVLMAVRQASNVLCDRWTLLILISAHSGSTRFGEFRDRLGVANRLLSSRLQTLIDLAIMQREAYQQHPPRSAYCLTDMGNGLFDVFAMMLRWEQKWSDTDPHLVINHRQCAANECYPEPRCANCNQCVASPHATDLHINQQEVLSMPGKPTTYRRSAANTGSMSTGRPLPLPTAVEVFGDKWTIEIIMCAFVRVRTFSGFQQHTGISSNILADRLARLTANGILKHNTNARSRSHRSYRLTSKGIDLFPTLVCIEAWADQWLSDRQRSPMQQIHRYCGQELELKIHCSGCGQSLTRQGCDMRLTQGT